MTSAERIARKKTEIRMRIADDISAGRSFHLTSAAIHARCMNEVPASFPTYARQYLYGYMEAKFEEIQNNELEFRYQMPDGRWIPAHDLEYANDCRALDCEHSGHVIARMAHPLAGHFWKGTDRPWHVSVM